MRASEAVSKANSERGQIPTLLVPNNIGNDAQNEPEFNIEKAYENAMSRTETAKESQMRNSAVEYIHLFTPNNI